MPSIYKNVAVPKPFRVLVLNVGCSDVKDSPFSDKAGQVDGWMDGWVDGRMEGWIEGWADGKTKRNAHSQTHTLTNIHTNSQSGLLDRSD
ncbi:MAG: hypothetical protein M3Y56_05240 [Armatimonadota bacterium]|nr:hypothetical protein [Armatimonadota bacterium]